MHIIETANLTIEQRRAVLALWNSEYPSQLTYNANEFDTYLNSLLNQRHYLLLDDTAEINGWLFCFERDKGNWFAIILGSKLQGKGFGKMLLDKIKENEKELCGWVTDHDNYRKNNGDIYRSPLGFYLKNGFVVCDGERLETEKLSAIKIRAMTK